jgi:hypothetical protein
MPVLCDFTTILDDDVVTIGNGLGDGTPTFKTLERTFNTGGRETGSPGFLIFNVRHLTSTDRNVEVKINGTRVGWIHRYHGGAETADDWFTQMIAVDGSTLRDGNNTLRIEAVGWPGSTDLNPHDDFQLKNLVCFFHQAA